jgi:hypothetical protein
MSDDQLARIQLIKKPLNTAPSASQLSQFRVIKDGRFYEENQVSFEKVSSSFSSNNEMGEQMRPPPPKKVINNEELNISSSIPDLGEFFIFHF